MMRGLELKLAIRPKSLVLMSLMGLSRFVWLSRLKKSARSCKSFDSASKKRFPKEATMATAHKIAVIFYTMVKNQVEYDETLWDARDAQREKRLEAKLKRQAKQLGYELVPIEPKAA